MMKSLSRLGIKWNVLSLIRGIYGKPADNITLKSEMLNSLAVIEFGGRLANVTASF